MNSVSKSTFGTLILTLALNSSFGQEAHTITLSLDRNNLIVDPDIAKIPQGDKVIWKRKTTRIEYFNILEPDPRRPRQPFKEGITNPNDNHTYIGERTVSYNVPIGDEWKYNIRYKILNGPLLSKDPKIAVKPPPFIPFLVRVAKSKPSFLIFPLITIISIIVAIVFYRKWRKAETELAGNNQQNT